MRDSIGNKIVEFALIAYAASVVVSLSYLSIRAGFVEAITVWSEARLPILGLIFAGFAVLIVMFVHTVPPKIILAYSTGPLLIEISATANFLRDFSSVPILRVEWGLLFLRLSSACLLAGAALRLVYVAKSEKTQGQKVSS